MFKPATFAKATSIERVDMFLNGEPLRVPARQTLAAALLGANTHTFRHTPVSGQARGPLCMMGVCFECLVEIDGVPNQQACMVEVANGMRVRLSEGARALEVEP